MVVVWVKLSFFHHVLITHCRCRASECLTEVFGQFVMLSNGELQKWCTHNMGIYSNTACPAHTVCTCSRNSLDLLRIVIE